MPFRKLNKKEKNILRQNVANLKNINMKMQGFKIEQKHKAIILLMILVTILTTLMFTIENRKVKDYESSISNLRKGDCIKVESNRLPSSLNSEYSIDRINEQYVRVCKK